MIQVAMVALAIVFKFIVMSRIWIPLAWMFGGMFIYQLTIGQGSIAGMNDQPVFTWAYIIGLIACFAYMAWSWIRGGIRYFIKDPSWSVSSSLAARSGDKLKGKAAANTKAGRPTGVVFGKASKGGSWVCRKENGQDHILVFGAPGLGKSQSIVIPSLHCWHGGKFVIDIKGELYENRPEGDSLMVSLNGDSKLGYDPFVFCDQLGQDVHDTCRDIALTLVPPNPNEKDPYWTEAAQNMLTGALLAGKSQSLSFIEIMDKVAGLGAVGLVEWTASATDRLAKIYNVQFVDMGAGKTLSAIYSGIMNKIAIFSVDEAIRTTFSKPEGNQISPFMLQAGYSIYVCIPEHKIEQYKNVTALIVNQTLRYCMKIENNTSQRILVIIDEFSRLGYIPIIKDGLATLRSKGVCITLITQSLAQLRDLYGRDGTDAILDLCSMKAILSASGETAALFSRMVGEAVEQMENQGTNKKQFDIGQGLSLGYSEQYQPIVRPSEFQNLGDELLLIEPSTGYVRVLKMPYWKNAKKYSA